MKVVDVAASVILCVLALTSCNTGTNPSNDPTIPVLSVDPSSLNFRGSETVQTLDIINDGGGALSWEIDTETGWIVCPVSSGETETSTTVEISVNGKEIGDSDQISEGTLTIYSNGGNYSVPVSYIPGFTLTGFVYEGEETEAILSPGARITVYSDTFDFFTDSDQDGWYYLEDVPIFFNYVEATKGNQLDRLESGTKLVIPDNNILEYDFYLMPVTGD